MSTVSTRRYSSNTTADLVGLDASPGGWKWAPTDATPWVRCHYAGTNGYRSGTPAGGSGRPPTPRRGCAATKGVRTGTHGYRGGTPAGGSGRRPTPCRRCATATSVRTGTHVYRGGTPAEVGASRRTAVGGMPYICLSLARAAALQHAATIYVYIPHVQGRVQVVFDLQTLFHLSGVVTQARNDPLRLSGSRSHTKATTAGRLPFAKAAWAAADDRWLC